MQNLDLKTIYEWPLIAQAVIIGLAVILLFILVYFIDLRPYNALIQNSKQQVVDLERQLSSLIDKQSTIKAAVDKLPVLNSKLKEWQETIITDKELPPLLDDLLKLAKNNYLNVLNFKPDREVTSGVYHEVPVYIEVVGTYDQIARYVSSLANLKKLIVVNSVAIYDETPNVPGSGGQFMALASDDLLSAEININIYKS